MKQLLIGTFLRVLIGVVSLSHTLTSLYCRSESLRMLQHTTSLQFKNKYSTFADCGLLFAKTDQYYTAKYVSTQRIQFHLQPFSG